MKTIYFANCGNNSILANCKSFNRLKEANEFAEPFARVVIIKSTIAQKGDMYYTAQKIVKQTVTLMASEQELINQVFKP